MTDINILYLETAAEYYIAGRASTFGQFRIAGILFHHSFEFLFKTQLYKRFTPRDLWKEFGHNLPKLWLEFKKDFPTSNLDKWDGLIEKISKWEELRYPDYDNPNGLQVFSWISESYLEDELMVYRGNIEELDKFFSEMIPLMDILPRIKDYIWRQYAYEMYAKQNKYKLW